MLRFANPEFLLLVPPAVLLAWWWARRRRPALRYSDTRLVAGLPAHTPIWHKTGSWREVATHDAGIVQLPDGTHLVLVVLVRQQRPDERAAERLIADVARAAWGFWAVPTFPVEGRSDSPE